MIDIILIFFGALLLFATFLYIYLKFFLIKYSGNQKESFEFYNSQFQDGKTEALEKEIKKLSKQLTMLLSILFFLILIVITLTQI